MTTPLTRDDWDRLAREATPEPWRVEMGHQDRLIFGPDGVPLAEVHWWLAEHAKESQANAAFIAAAREAVPALLSALSASESRAQALEDALGELVGAIDELIASSTGVYGLHRSGEIAAWADLLEGGAFEEWLLPLSRSRSLREQGEKTG